MVDAYPLGFACERDKVLFGQLLKLGNSQLWIPKEIFRFSTFDEHQKIKLTEFLRKTPDEKFIIKPTNSSLTHGVLVVHREKIIEIIMLIVDNLKKLPQAPREALMNPSFRSMYQPLVQALLAPLTEHIAQLVYPNFRSDTPIIQDIVTCDIRKFIGYWFSTDVYTVLHSDRDFFLIEAFKPPKRERDETNKCNTAVASRGYFAIPDINSTPPLPISVISKRCYKVEKLSPDAPYIAEVSFCDNFYTYDFAKTHRAVVSDCIANYALRSKQYQEKTTAAFTKDSERAWMKMLATLSVSDFIARIQTANPENRELLEYLASQSVQDLNLENMEFCWHCYKMSDASSFQKCGACLHARYCDATCQRADWGIHKTECKILKARLAMPAAASALT